MRPLITLVFAAAAVVQMQPALAETLRCGSVLIEPGDDAAYVLKNCGEPNMAAPTSGPELVPEFGSTSYPVATLRASRWRYDRGIGQFSAVVVIGDDGRVEEIQFDRHRG